MQTLDATTVARVFYYYHCIYTCFTYTQRASWCTDSFYLEIKFSLPALVLRLRYFQADMRQLCLPAFLCSVAILICSVLSAKFARCVQDDARSAATRFGVLYCAARCGASATLLFPTRLWRQASVVQPDQRSAAANVSNSIQRNLMSSDVCVLAAMPTLEKMSI